MVDVLRPCAANAMISAGKVHLRKLLDKKSILQFCDLGRRVCIQLNPMVEGDGNETY